MVAHLSSKQLAGVRTSNKVQVINTQVVMEEEVWYDEVLLPYKIEITYNYRRLHMRRRVLNRLIDLYNYAITQG